MSNMRPAKKAKLVSLQGELSSLVLAHEEELRRKDEALQEAMQLLFGDGTPSDWKSMPPALRKDPTALIQAIVNKNFVYLKREDIPKQVLQEALPVLLANQRLEAVKACEDGLLKWEEVNPTPEEWRESADLSAEALRRGLVQNIADVPALTRNEMVRALKESRLLWNHIPTDMQNDQEFCRWVLDPKMPHGDADDQIITFQTNPRRYLHRRHHRSSDELAEFAIQIFRLHPAFVQDCKVWENLFDGFDYSSPLLTIFEEGFQPTDAGLMERACTKWKNLLSSIDQLAFSNVVQKLINDDANNLFWVTTRFIEAFPEFVTEKLAHVRLGDDHVVYVQSLAKAIPSVMWNNEDFARTWFKAGLPLMADEHPAAWKADPDKLLLVAKHGAKCEWKLSALRQAPEELRGDSNFMVQIMQVDPCLFECASETMRNENFELAVWALGNDRFLRHCVEGIRSERMRAEGTLFFGSVIVLKAAKIDEIFIRAQSELALHKAFVNPFLCAVSDESNLLLGKLYQPMFLEAIGDFLGIPRGNHLRNIRMALNAMFALLEKARQASAKNQDGSGDGEDNNNIDDNNNNDED